MSKQYNSLPQAQQYKLMRWVDDNHQRAADNTAAELAKLASADLGFSVTESNAQSARAALGIRPRHSGAGRRNGSIKSPAEVVARELVWLLKELGMPVDDELQSIASHTARPRTGDLFDK